MRIMKRIVRARFAEDVDALLAVDACLRSSSRLERIRVFLLEGDALRSRMPARRADPAAVASAPAAVAALALDITPSVASDGVQVSTYLLDCRSAEALAGSGAAAGLRTPAVVAVESAQQEGERGVAEALRKHGAREVEVTEAASAQSTRPVAIASLLGNTPPRNRTPLLRTAARR